MSSEDSPENLTLIDVSQLTVPAVLASRDSLDALTSCQRFIGALSAALTPPPLSRPAAVTVRLQVSLGVGLLPPSHQIRELCILHPFLFQGDLVHSYVPTFAPCSHPFSGISMQEVFLEDLLTVF